jgi:hypothetical protein
MPATNPIFKSDPFSDSHFKVKIPAGFITLVLGGIFFAGCQSYLKSAPPITESFIQAGLREKADGPTLAEGRKLFLNRCIACHALPEIARYEPGANSPHCRLDVRTGSSHADPEGSGDQVLADARSQ